nr:MAG TPA: Keratin, type II cytoskeletal 1 filament, cytoskeleton, skin, coiled-coil [Caudoviricetes sp.]
MKKIGIQKSSLLLPLGCLLLVVSMSLTVQAGSPQKTDEVTEYVMTEYQYSKLKSNLAELKKINIQSQTALQQSREELRASNSKLLTLQNQLKELNNVCLTLKVKTKEQESLLQNANQSLAQLEKEFNLKRKQIKRQRNIAYVIAGCALYVAIKN